MEFIEVQALCDTTVYIFKKDDGKFSIYEKLDPTSNPIFNNFPDLNTLEGTRKFIQKQNINIKKDREKREARARKIAKNTLN